MSPTIRAFIAIEFSIAFRQHLDNVIQRISKSIPDRTVNWVQPDNIHITLKFLGDVPTDHIPQINTALDNALRRFDLFKFTASGLGCFPNPRRPRVIWAGVDEAGGRRMIALASAVEAALNPLGYLREDRPFAPHITLGRVRRETQPREAARVGIVVAAQPIEQWGVEPVTAAYVMQSELKSGGPIYTPLQRIDLTDREDLPGLK